MILSCGGFMKSIKKEDIKDLSYKDITNIILENNINVTIRKGMGRDIDAACGQLRRRRSENT